MDLMDKIVSWAKRRGFIYPGSEIYGGLANSWDFGPLGTELKNNIRDEWWRVFMRQRQDMLGIDAALIMNSKIWQASGHLEDFNDPLVEDKKTHERYRLDHLLKDAGVDVDGMDFKKMTEKIREMGLKSPKGNELTEPRMFNMMFETHLGPVTDKDNTVYLRPETAQAMFVNFKNILDTNRIRLPFGIAQIGRSFRNEITPGNFIFRTREFDQMEIEYFCREKEWEHWFEYWLSEMHAWIEHCGINKKRIHDYETPKEELAHYSKRTIDIEYDFPFGKKELYGLAYRSDHDLRQHSKNSGEDLRYTDPQTNEKFIPHVIEPSFGLERTLLVVLLESYTEEDVKGEKRIVAKFPRWMAPIKVAVFPLLSNNDKLVEKAKNISNKLRVHYLVQYDDGGAIGRRYRRHDEIGTPLCITIDHDTLKDDTVTIRDRDSMEQIRVSADKLNDILNKFYEGANFSSLGK